MIFHGHTSNNNYENSNNKLLLLQALIKHIIRLASEKLSSEGMVQFAEVVDMKFWNQSQCQNPYLFQVNWSLESKNKVLLLL